MLFSCSRRIYLPTFGLGVVLLSLGSVARATNLTGYLYVSDYGSQDLDRYSYTYNSTTNLISNVAPAGFGGNTTSAVFINGGVKEGVQGTLNDIIVVATGGASLNRYDLNGNLIGTINVTNANGTAHTFSGIGNVVITSDGKFLYAPEETAGVIDKISLATGKIVDTVAFTGAHDLAIAADGTIYAAAYDKGDSTSSGVYAFKTDLTGKTQLITTSGGLTSPTGISVAKDGSLYIQQNVHNDTSNPTTAGGPDGVYHYTITGTGTTATATFDPTDSLTSSTSLHFTFGNNIGPDGNIYIAALGGASGRSGNTGYTDGVYEYDPTSKVVSQIIAGEITGSTSSGASGMVAPKYLQFGLNFVPAFDAGVTPEPSSVVMALSFLGVMGGGALRARRRRRARK